MTDLQATQAALDSRLNSLPGSIPISWPNIKYVPNVSTMYLRPTFLPGKSTRLVINDTIQSNTGIYQVDVFGVQNKGNGPVLTQMDSISDFFKQEQILTSGDVSVLIRAVTQLPIKTLDSWIMGSVQINYTVYSS